MCRTIIEGEPGRPLQAVPTSPTRERHDSPSYPMDRHFSVRSRQHSVLQCLLFSVTFLVLILLNDPHGLIRNTTETSRKTISPTSLPPNDFDLHQQSSSPSFQPASKNTILHKLGWLDTITYFQKEIAVVANQMHHDNFDPQLNQTGVIDITPLQTIVSHALEEVGVKGLFFQIFSHDNKHLVYFYNFTASLIHCSKRTHGVGCQSHQPWWFYHFVGAITADKLLKEHKLLWDGGTSDSSSSNVEYVEHMADLLHRVHIIQNTTWVGDFSFHAQHALEWQYVADTVPDVQEYPVDLAQSFCGDFQHDNRHTKSTKKRIGYECYHGMGHSMFYVAALRQVSRMSTEQSLQQFGMAKEDMIMPHIQFRPNSGLELTQRTFCEIRKLCAGATGAVEALPGEETCWGGVVHSIRLYTNRTVIQNKQNAMQLLRQRFQQCEEDKEDGVRKSIPLEDLDDVVGYEQEEFLLEQAQQEEGTED